MLGVQYCSTSELDIGDIAVWFDGRQLRSHRVVALDERGRFATRSDLARRDDMPASDNELLGRAVSFRMLGIAYRLDRGLPATAGRFIARAPWLGSAFVRLYGPPRQCLGRVADAAYTVAPVRALRRQLDRRSWELRAERSPRELRVSAVRNGKSVGQARLDAARFDASGNAVGVGPDGTWVLEDIWVARSMRGLGLGRELLMRAIEEALGGGATELCCRRETGRRATRLLASSGFGRGPGGWVLRLR